MAKLSDSAVAALLEAPNYATITTVNEDESLTSSIIWCDVDGDQLAVNGAEGRRWTDNARRDGRASILVSSNPWEYVELRGRLVEAADGADDHIDRLAKKYIDADEYPFRQPGEVRLKFHLDAATVRYQKQG